MYNKQGQILEALFLWPWLLYDWYQACRSRKIRDWEFTHLSRPEREMNELDRLRGRKPQFGKYRVE